MLWDIVRSYDEFCSFIEDHYNRLEDIPFTISFDHDLDREHYRYLKHPIPYQNLNVKTGYHCALWLKEFCTNHNLKLPEIMIHTLNPAGRENIAGVFSNKAF